MKKTKIDPFAPLDKYEEDLMKAINNDEFVEVSNAKKEIERIRTYAKAYLKKNKRITLRIKETDLKYIQHRAMEKGIPYQTLISVVLHQFANGKINVSI
jgi:predicted DNA binding CopG/RHH family protein